MLTYLVPVAELGIVFIDLDTNFGWRCDIYKYVDCDDSSALLVWSSLKGGCSCEGLV